MFFSPHRAPTLAVNQRQLKQVRPFLPPTCDVAILCKFLTKFNHTVRMVSNSQPLLILCIFLLSGLCYAQLGLGNGFMSFNTPSFAVQLVKDSQTLYSLKPTSGGGAFDFIPADKMTQRQSNGQYHLGDITFRARRVGTTAWISGDSSTARRVVSPLAASGSTFAAANLTATLPSTSLLSITRRWVLNDNQLQLLFDVTNPQTTAVEIGALGAPLEFNNVRFLTSPSAILADYHL